MARPRGRKLGEIIEAIMLDERIVVADLMRASGLARNTIRYMIRGRTQNPERSTLRRLATGLATDPVTGELDMTKMTRYERQLDVAAGYADPDLSEAETMLETLLRYQLQSRTRASSVVELVHCCETLDDAAIRRLIAAARQ